MKNYFGRLVSARSGRGVLRPPRMLFGAAPRVAVSEAAGVARGATVEPAKASVERAAGRPVVVRGETGVEEERAPREKRALVPKITPVLQSEPVAQPAAAVKKEEARIRPVASAAPIASGESPRATVKARVEQTGARVVMQAEEEEKREPERVVAHPPPVRPDDGARKATPYRTEPVTMRPAAANEAPPYDPPQYDPPRMPDRPGAVKAAAEDGAKMPNTALRPVVPAFMTPATALRTIADVPRQEPPKVEIGTIEVRIVSPQKRTVMPGIRSAEAPARAGTLARGFFHSFGIRQG